MAMTFDTPSRGTDRRSQDLQNEADDPCGRGVDWSKGLQGLPKSSRPISDYSGSLLTKVIEGEIIPRILLAHRNAGPSSPPKPVAPEILSSEAFARLVLDSGSEEITAHVQTLLDAGMTLDQVFLDLLAPVARRLGQLWEEDACTFTDVTLGLSRLHRVLHETSRRNGGTGMQPRNSRRAFFAPVPGEQHTFGVSMLEEFFANAGWQTQSDYAPTVDRILRIAATERLDIIGFSIGCKELIDPLSDLIEKTLDVTCNRNLTVMVGGGLFVENRDLAARLGKATIVSDGVRAVQVAEEIVSRTGKAGSAGQLV